MIQLFQFYLEVIFVWFEFMVHLSRVTEALKCKKILLLPLHENEIDIQQLCVKTVLNQQ